MKTTFTHLPDEKKNTIIQACIEEFGGRGFEKSTTDRIIKKAGISKGGLYEYISSKEELFLFIVEFTYDRLYGYIKERIKETDRGFPEDVLERLSIVAECAADFYIAHPKYIYFLTKTHQVNDEALEKKVMSIFTARFLEIFGDISAAGLMYKKDQVLDLIMWFLLKTRRDFLLGMKNSTDVLQVKENYRKNWTFYLSVLEKGIYTEP